MIEIRELRPSDAHIAALLHQEGQPGTVLTALGIKFLNALYTKLGQSEVGIAFVATQDGQVVGVIAGTTDTHALFRELIIKRGVSLRQSAPDRKSQRLFDTLEVVLTRLDMLDVQSASDRRSFAKLLRATNLAGQINEILTDWEEPSPARSWLIETQILLMGAEHAG